MELIDRLRVRGWRLTSQRRVIAQVLSGPSMHPTAEEVLAKARETLPEISVATVYNTLNELVEMGELAEVDGSSQPGHRAMIRPSDAVRRAVGASRGKSTADRPGPVTKASAVSPATDR
jgi:hypothetical protein